jgi:hypothetical protein
MRAVDMARDIVEEPPPLNSFTNFPYRVEPAPLGTFVNGGMLSLAVIAPASDSATHFEP